MKIIYRVKRLSKVSKILLKVLLFINIMDYNFPTLNKDLVSELSELFNELTLLTDKYRELYIKIESTNNQQELSKNAIKDLDERLKGLEENLKNKLEQNHNSKLLDYDKKIAELEKKTDILHSLFNVYKDINCFDYELVINKLLSNNKFINIENNLTEIKSLYENFNHVKTSLSNEKMYNKLYDLNRKLLKSHNVLEENNKELRVIVSEQVLSIKNLENNLSHLTKKTLALEKVSSSIDKEINLPVSQKINSPVKEKKDILLKDDYIEEPWRVVKKKKK